MQYLLKNKNKSNKFEKTKQIIMHYMPIFHKKKNNYYEI